MRENSDCCAGGGRFNIDFPGVGIVTADDDGEPDEFGEVMDGQQFREPLNVDDGLKRTLLPLNFVHVTHFRIQISNFKLELERS